MFSFVCFCFVLFVFVLVLVFLLFCFVFVFVLFFFLGGGGGWVGEGLVIGFFIQVSIQQLKVASYLTNECSKQIRRGRKL